MAKKQRSEVTVVMQVTLTDIFPVVSDENVADEETQKEIARITAELQKIKGLSKIDIDKVKIFPNIKT